MILSIVKVEGGEYLRSEQGKRITTTRVEGPMVERVLESWEMDIDGPGSAWHRVKVPASIASNFELAGQYAVADEQMSGSHEVCAVYDSIPARVAHNMSRFDAEYWLSEGYHSVFPS